MELRSPAFNEGDMIPKIYTCDSTDISPPLEWTDVPEGTQSLALINDDPDAPMGTWVHWVYYNIPAGLTGLPEYVAPEARPETGGEQGITDFGRIGYGGPCPPDGTHRYYFKLYALDTTLELGQNATKDQVLRAMEGHVLDQAELMGRYQR